MRPRPNRLRHRTGQLRITVALTAVAITMVLAGVWWGTDPAGAAMPMNAEPFVDCVFVDTDGTQIALFGYTNPHPDPIVPDQNHFTPEPENRGQPTTLQPGTHRGVFSTTFTGTKLTWHLDSNKATASIDSSPTCASNPAVPEAATVILIPLVGAAVAGYWWFTKGRALAHA